MLRKRTLNLNSTETSPGKTEFEKESMHIEGIRLGQDRGPGVTTVDGDGDGDGGRRDCISGTVGV